MTLPETYKTWTDQAGLAHAGEIFGSANGFSVIECKHCGYMHVIPLPTAKELQTTYTDDYYDNEKPFYIERYLEDKEWWDAVYQDRYKTIEGFLTTQDRTILDVGSGPGLFLAIGSQRGWRVKGIEPSKKAASFSREKLHLDIEEAFLTSTLAQTLGQYDVVHMGEVLEHLPEPSEIIEIAHELLKDGGIITLVVPNDFNPIQKILTKGYGFDPWWIAPPHHLNYFDKESLIKLVEKRGFEVLLVEATFPIDLFLLMGKNYIGNDIQGREVHGLRMKFDLALLNAGGKKIRDDLYRNFAEIGLGREIVLYARRIDKGKPGSTRS